MMSIWVSIDHFHCLCLKTMSGKNSQDSKSLDELQSSRIWGVQLMWLCGCSYLLTWALEWKARGSATHTCCSGWRCYILRHNAMKNTFSNYSFIPCYMLNMSFFVIHDTFLVKSKKIFLTHPKLGNISILYQIWYGASS